MPVRTPAQAQPAPQTTPCGDPTRSPLDVVGRFNDLINCYLTTAGAHVKSFLINGSLTVILVVIILIAAYTFIKE